MQHHRLFSMTRPEAIHFPDLSPHPSTPLGLQLRYPVAWTKTLLRGNFACTYEKSQQSFHFSCSSNTYCSPLTNLRTTGKEIEIRVWKQHRTFHIYQTSANLIYNQNILRENNTEFLVSQSHLWLWFPTCRLSDCHVSSDVCKNQTKLLYGNAEVITKQHNDHFASINKIRTWDNALWNAT